MADRSCNIEVIKHADSPVIHMIWPHTVDVDNLVKAYQHITDLLKLSPEPLYIMVDLRNDPEFPIVDTVMAALRGPYRHPNLEEWLVIQGNHAAHMIGNMLARAARRNNIRWFNDEQEAMSYLMKRISTKVIE